MNKNQLFSKQPVRLVVVSAVSNIFNKSVNFFNEIIERIFK